LLKPKGDLIRRLREQKCLSQEDLAKKAGFSVRTIQRAEAGEPAKPNTLKCISDVLNVPPEDLIDGPEMIPSELIIDPEGIPQFAKVVCDYLQEAGVSPAIIWVTAAGICTDLASVLGKNTVFAQQLVAEVDDYLCPPCDADFEYLSESDD
jgi:transcriptional regulator with XRE-family HTH domain